MKELRDGFTTGSAAAAAILAGYRYLTGGEILPQEELILPGGVVLNIPVKALPDGWFAVQKDAGDDPDVTDKCIVKVKVVRGGAAGAGDLVEDCGRGKLIIRGGSGVGRITRPGLAVAPGYPAINPGPRRIIKDNLMRMGFGGKDEVLTLEIAVENGEELARKTLNPALGIVGGISILGNSGIVKPYSHAAYVDTIKLQCRAALAAGKIPGFASGRRSGDALKRDFPMVEPIVSGDFIGEAVAAAVEAGAQEIIVGCMPGKLFKYACGLKNTHAHINPADMEQLRVFARQAGCDLPGNITILGEAAALMPEELYQSMLSIICRKADTVLNEWGGKMNVVVAVYNEIGERLPL